MNQKKKKKKKKRAELDANNVATSLLVALARIELRQQLLARRRPLLQGGHHERIRRP